MEDISRVVILPHVECEDLSGGRTLHNVGHVPSGVADRTRDLRHV